MSIATEIQRLQTAKANIKTAIENKGVTVGDDTIDTYAEKIGEISVGGGLPTNITELNSGTWTQATSLGDGGTLDIEHGLTDIPDVVVISSDVFDIAPSGHNLAYMFYEKATTSSGYTVYYNGATTTRINAQTISQGITAVDDSKFTITTVSNRRLSAGVTFSWLAMRWAK